MSDTELRSMLLESLAKMQALQQLMRDIAASTAQVGAGLVELKVLLDAYAAARGSSEP